MSALTIDVAFNSGIMAGFTRVGISDESAGSSETSDTRSLSTNGRIDFGATIAFSLFRSAGKNDFLVGGNQEGTAKDGQEKESK